MPEWVEKYWIEWIFGLVVAVLGACYKRLANRFKREREERIEKAKKDEKEMQALKDGMRSLLKRQLIEDCEAAIRQGFCEPALKESIQDMGSCYETLGGNGVIPPMLKQVSNLPTFKLTPTKGEAS